MPSLYNHLCHIFRKEVNHLESLSVQRNGAEKALVLLVRKRIAIFLSLCSLDIA